MGGAKSGAGKSTRIGEHQKKENRTGEDVGRLGCGRYRYGLEIPHEGLSYGHRWTQCRTGTSNLIHKWKLPKTALPEHDAVYFPVHDNIHTGKTAYMDKDLSLRGTAPLSSW